jgi:hypothetical protein
MQTDWEDGFLAHSRGKQVSPEIEQMCVGPSSPRLCGGGGGLAQFDTRTR